MDYLFTQFLLALEFEIFCISKETLTQKQQITNLLNALAKTLLRFNLKIDFLSVSEIERISNVFSETIGDKLEMHNPNEISKIFTNLEM